MLEGYSKVAQEGGTYVVATFYNPDTRDVYTTCVRDYDYSDCSRDKDELYYIPIDNEVRHLYLMRQGVISVGDKIEVVKGRKVPIGTVATVVKLYDWRDSYGRAQTRYAVLDNGMKTNVNNCKILEV